MVLDSELIWTADFSTVPVQVVCGYMAQNHHDQNICMNLQGEGDQVGYKCQETGFPYQEVILSNNKVVFITI